MAVFQYQSGSLLDEVQVLTNDSGGMRAYFHARDDASPQQLRQVQQLLDSLGWKSVAREHDGKQTLEVRGFKKLEHLLPVLEKAELVQGRPISFTPQEGDVPTWKEWFSNATLKGAGISYIVGDMAYLTYAYKQLQHEKALGNSSIDFFNRMNIVTGIGYNMGSLALAKYGSRDQSLNTIQMASEKIYNYILKEGIPLGPDAALKKTSAEKKRGFWERLDHTFAKYPSEVLNSVYVFVGASLSAMAIYRVTRPGISAAERSEEMWDIGLGGVTMSSALAGLLIKEKKPIEGQPKPETTMGRVWQWIQEKPLRATGLGYMIATGFHGVGTAKKYMRGDKNIRDTVMYRGIFVAANVVSEIMLAFSSKGHGTGVKPDDSVDRTVIAATAEMILNQPPEKREQLVYQLSGYMSTADVLGLQADDIAAELRRQLDGMKHNPWMQSRAPHLVGEVLAERSEGTSVPHAPQPVTQRGVTYAKADKPGTLVDPASIQKQAMLQQAANDNVLMGVGS